MEQDCIAAISTGLLPGGIGIVRISGAEAVKLCEPLVSIRAGALESLEANRLYYGKIKDGGTVLDEALIAVLRAPHSYTAEDTVELQCHGGPLVLRRVLEAVLKAGARLAEPGEFTKRAFLNGRLDLSEAEAVMDLIEAENDFARDTALRQLSGAHSEQIKAIREVILEKTAYLEAALDDPENYSLDGFKEEFFPTVEMLREKIGELLSCSEDGRKLAEGVETAIVGRPNVGKSSLMNRLLGRERAIVTEIPGTTRDTVEESLRNGDVILKLADTAGIRREGDPVEKIGIERAREKAKESDLILMVTDGSRSLTEEDAALIEECGEKPCIILLNKADLGLREQPEAVSKRFHKPCFAVSALNGEGIEPLLKEIRRMFHFEEVRQKPLVVTSLRHQKLLKAALTSLDYVSEALKSGMPEDLLSIDLMDAYRSLGLIIGEEAGDDLIDEIFGKFCMGK